MNITSIPTPTLTVNEKASQAFAQEVAKFDWLWVIKQTVINVITLWPVWILLATMALPTVTYKLYHYFRLSKAGMFDIDKMTGEEFEERLAILLRNLGYNVVRTGKVGDYGVDLVVERNGIRTAVQAKCYKSGKVHPDAVQEVYAGKNRHNCTEAMVVSNRNFTTEAWRLARSDSVKLWSRNYLAKVLLTEKAKRSSLEGGHGSTI